MCFFGSSGGQLLTHPLNTFYKGSMHMSKFVLSSFGGILLKVVALFEFSFFISVSGLEIVPCLNDKLAAT